MSCAVKLLDAVLFFFFLVIAIVTPLFDAQTCLPKEYYPKVLVDLKSWYGNEYGDYLVMEKPSFFVGLVSLELCVLWPLSVVNLYGLISRKSWFGTTCLIYGVSMATSMVAIIAEIIGSNRASDTLKMIYYPFMGLSLLAVLRGLLSSSCETRTVGSGKRPLLAARKKRA
ncbi:hypothetical protein RND81_08G012900 [Saponaria officinalis]|uniref:EXPERA domain-containing protein n=1 Tax=Saponaria officinalis TaxID=3572 RepID=A0AAW1J1N0_SAPOF